MKILCLSDTHIGSGYEHRRDALADTREMFDHVLDLVLNREIELVLHAGDVFHRAKPTPEELHVFKWFVDRLEALEIPLVAIGGNGMHEAAVGAKSALELFTSRTTFVTREPKTFFFGNLAISTLPASRDSIDETIASARQLFEQARATRSILLAHQMVSGAQLPTGLTVDQISSDVIPVWALEEIGYDAIVLGDIHKAQTLGPMMWYCGSPLCQDFGEQDEKHGVWIWDSASDRYSAEFVSLAQRRFVTIDIDLTREVSEPGSSAADVDTALTAEQAALFATASTSSVLSESVGERQGWQPGSLTFVDETLVIGKAIAEKLPLDGAIVRVRYRATEEQHRRVDIRALEKLLVDSGVHHIFGGIAWEAVRENRARVAQLDESLEPLAAVDLWIAATSVDDNQGANLKVLVNGWLETVDV